MIYLGVFLIGFGVGGFFNNYINKKNINGIEKEWGLDD